MTEHDWFALTEPRLGLEYLRRRASIRKHRLFAVACWRKVKVSFLYNDAMYGFQLVEELADGLIPELGSRVYRDELQGKAVRWIDGYREERDNNCRSNTTGAVRDAFEWEEEFHNPDRADAANTLDTLQDRQTLLDPGFLEQRIAALEIALRPRLMSSHIGIANAVAHRKRPRDAPHHRNTDPAYQLWFRQMISEELRSQLPLLFDIFGNPFQPVGFEPSWRTSTASGLASAIYVDRAFDRMPILADALEEAGCDNPDILNHCRGDGPHVRGCWVVDLVLGKN